MYSPAARPSSVRAAPAKKRMLSEETGISSRAAGSGLPTFCDSSWASSSVFASIASASFEQQLGALAGRRLEPLGQRGLGRLDRAVDVRLGALRHLGDRLCRRRVEDLGRLAFGGVDPLAADEVLVTGNRDAHLTLRFVRRCERTPRHGGLTT